MKKKAKKVLPIVLLLAVVIIMLFKDMLVSKEIEPEYIFTYAENQTDDYPTTLGAIRFAELVEKRTQGRIRIIVHAEALLGTEQEVIRQLQYGGIDFARVSISQLAEFVPEMNVLQMPYLYENSDHMWRVLDGDIGQTFLEYPTDEDIVGLSWYDAGARNFYSTNKPITCLEDVMGMRIRVQESDVAADMVETLGATALKLPYADVYSSLERGLCDGAENNWPSYEAMNHYQVAKYYSVDEHTRVPEMQICSMHTWKKLTDADKHIILECAKESALYQRELWAEQEATARRNALANGVEEVILAPKEKQRFREEMSEIYVKYCGEYMDMVNQIIAAGGENRNGTMEEQNYKKANDK